MILFTHAVCLQRSLSSVYLCAIELTTKYVARPLTVGKLKVSHINTTLQVYEYVLSILNLY